MVRIDTTPSRNPEVVGRMVGSDAVLVLPLQGQVKVLNEVGAYIWSLVDGEKSVHQIVQQVIEAYEVERAQAEADALAFIEELANKKLVFLSN